MCAHGGVVSVEVSDRRPPQWPNKNLGYADEGRVVARQGVHF